MSESENENENGMNVFHDFVVYTYKWKIVIKSFLLGVCYIIERALSRLVCFGRLIFSIFESVQIYIK